MVVARGTSNSTVQEFSSQFCDSCRHSNIRLYMLKCLRTTAAARGSVFVFCDEYVTDLDNRSKNFDKRPNRRQKNSAPQEDGGKVVDKALSRS